MEIVKYSIERREELAKFFIDIISQHKEYISHGELQMGIAKSETEISDNAKELWLAYLDRQSENEAIEICLAIESGEIVGFAIGGTEDDGDKPYGVIYDVSVKVSMRGQGVGRLLMDRVLTFIKSSGVTNCYLESGLNNHSAHHFFERYGFEAVSKIFKANI